MALITHVIFMRFNNKVLTNSQIHCKIKFVAGAITYLERWSSWFKAPVLKTGVGVSLP